MSKINKETEETLEKLGKEYPQFMTAFHKLMHESGKAGAIDEKTKELIGTAISVSKQCKWCIHHHVKNALKLGASKDEIMESCFVAVLMGGGPSLMYIQEVIKAIEE
ncbi:MAG: carboxymuconolactone decarboxylase family protein [Candidatus Nanoarchaeia archaeon]